MVVFSLKSDMLISANKKTQIEKSEFFMADYEIRLIFF